MKKLWLPSRGLIKPTRRALITGAVALLAAPHIAKAQLLTSGVGGGGFGPGGGGGLGLQTNCTGFWEFQTTSWLDATGNGTTLTGTGSPTTATGVVGNAVSLVVGSTQYLTAANNTNIANAGGSFSVQIWINTSGVMGASGIFSKSLNTFGNRDWGLGTYFTGTGQGYYFRVTNTATANFDASDPANLTGGVFTHLVATVNSATGAVIFYKNAVSVGTNTLTGTINSTASTLNFGYDGSAIAGSDSLLDQAGFWKGRVLSAGDVTALYNSGSGLSWAAML